MQKSLWCHIASLFCAMLASALLAIPDTGAAITFAPQTTVGTGQSGPRSVAVADLDGDGDPDMVVGHDTSNRVAVLRNNGAGTFTRSPLSVGSQPVFALLSDLNGDTRPDLVTAERADDALSILLNTSSSGAVSFQESAHSPFALTGEQEGGPAFVSSANFDGDVHNRHDLAVISLEARTISVLLQQADGSFLRQDEPTPFPLESNETCCSGPKSLAWGDLNGDGAVDLVAASVSAPFGGISERVLVWLNSRSVPPFDDNEKIRLPIFAAQNGDPACDTSLINCHTMSVAVARINADSSPDIVVANEFTGLITVLFNNGNPTSAESFTRVDVSTGHNKPVFVTAGDLDYDGDNDLVVVNRGSNNIAVLLNNGNGTFAQPQSFPVGTSPVFAAFADLNGDGFLDLAVVNNGSGTVSILLQQVARFSATQQWSVTDDGWNAVCESNLATSTWSCSPFALRNNAVPYGIPSRNWKAFFLWDDTQGWEHLIWVYEQNLR